MSPRLSRYHRHDGLDLRPPVPGEGSALLDTRGKGLGVGEELIGEVVVEDVGDARGRFHGSFLRGLG